MTDNSSEIDITAKSTIGKSTASNQISSRAKELGKLVEKGLSGLGPKQVEGFLNQALGEIGEAISSFEKDYDTELLRFERLLTSRKAKVTKAVSSGLIKVNMGQGKEQNFYAIEYAQMYNAFFDKVLKIVKSTKSQGASAILDEIKAHIGEMIGNDGLSDEDRAKISKLTSEIQALHNERSKIKVVEIGKPPEQSVTVNVKQENKITTPEEAASLIKEKKAAGAPIAESASLHTSVIKKLEEDVARLQKEMQAADKRAEELFDAIDAGDMTVTQSEADAAEEDFQKKEHLWKKAQEDLEREKAAQKREASSGTQELTAADVIAFRQNQKEATETTKKPLSKPDVRGSVAKKSASTGGGKQPPSEADADYVKGARERIKVLDDAYDQFLGMQSMWMSGIEQSITDMLDGVRLASQEMVFVITAEIQKNIGGKLKVIGKQIEESFGAKSTSGVASIAGKLDTINTTLTEIKNGLVRQKYIQDVKSVQKSVEDAAPQAAIAEITAEVMNRELAPIFGEVLGEQSDLNWQRYLTLEGDVRKPILDKIVGMSPSHFAAGGPLIPGQTAVVGEEGPEMLVPAGRGFHVLNNKIFRAMGGARFLAKGTTTAGQETVSSNVSWAPPYVTDMAEGIAHVTAEALTDALQSEIGPDMRTAGGKLSKTITKSVADIVAGNTLNEAPKPIDAVTQLKLDRGKLGMQMERLASSFRYAITGGLIFAHVLRMLTSTSQVYQKGMASVGRGWGYMLDMILRPLIPVFMVITRGFVWLGKIFAAHPMLAAMTAFGLIAAAVTAAGYAIWRMKKDIENASAAFEKLTAAMSGTPYSPSEPQPGILSRIWGGAKEAGGRVRDWFTKPVTIKTRPLFKKKAQSGYRIPGYGGGDSVGILAEPGELIVPKEVVRGFEHRADGGITGSSGDFGSWMGGVLGSVGDVFKGGVGAIASGIGAFLSSDIGQSIVGGLGVMGKMLGMVMAPIAGVGLAIGTIKGGLGSVGRIFMKGQQAQVEATLNTGKALRIPATISAITLAGILGVAVGILAMVSNLAQGKENPTIGFLGGIDIWDLIKTSAKEIWDFIKTPIKEVWEFLKGTVKSIWDFVVATLKSIWDFVKPALKSLWEFVKPVLKSIWEFVKPALKSIWEYVKPVFKGIWEFVKTEIKDVWDFIKTPVKSIWEFITGGKTGEETTPEKAGWKSSGVKGGIITGALVGFDELINKKIPLEQAAPTIGIGALIGGAAGAITAVTGGLTGGPFAALGHDWSVGFGSRTGGTIADALGIGGKGKEITEDVGGMIMSVINDSLGWAATGLAVGGPVGAAGGAILGPVFGGIQDLFKIREEVGRVGSGVKLTDQYGLVGSMAATAYNVGTDLRGVPGAVSGGIDTASQAISDALTKAGELLTTTVNTVKGVIDGAVEMVTGWQEAAANAGASLREAILGAFESLGEYLAGLPSAIMGMIDKYMSGLPVIGGLWTSAKGAIGFPSMARGGDILSDGFVKVHSGETITPARVNMNSSSRSSVSSGQITNHNTFVIQREDDRILFQKFQQMMVAEQRRLVI